MSQVCKFINSNSDFELLIGNEGQLVRTRTEAGFEFLFKSAKTNYGIKKGKYMYEVRISEFLETENYYGPGHKAKTEFSQKTLSEFDQKYTIRLGWSCSSFNKQIGVDSQSFGIDNNGDRWYGGQSRKYCDKLQQGDVIRCCLEIDDRQIFSFYKNGEYLGGCLEIIPQKNQLKGWFPSISIRNVSCEFNFGAQEAIFHPILNEIVPDSEEENKNKIEQEEQQQQEGEKIKDEKTEEQQQQEGLKQENQPQQQQQQQPPPPQAPLQLPATGVLMNQQDLKKYQVKFDEYRFINFSTEDQRENYVSKDKEGPPKLIFMVGLPSSGKTTFAEQYLLKYPHTIHLSTQIVYEHIIQNIKISHANQKIILLMELCDEIFVKLMKLSSYLRKDVIIDQCNVLLRARLEKLSYFKHHQNEAVVLITSEVEQAKRQMKKERKQDRFIPRCGIQTLANMKENFVIPTESEGFTRVHFVELEEDHARKVVVLSKEISELQVHPLFRKKNFKEIEDFKAKYNLTKNEFNIQEYERQQEEKARALQQQQQAEQLKKQQEEEQLKLKQQQQEQQQQQDQQNGEQNGEQQQAQQPIEQEGQEQQQAQNKEQQQVQGEQQEPQQQQQQQQSQQPQQQQPDQNQTGPEPQQEMPKPEQQAMPPVQYYTDQGRGDGPMPSHQGYPPQQQPPRNNNNRGNNKFIQKQNQKNNQHFNRLAEKRNEQFPYSQQAPQYHQQPPPQQQYPPQQHYGQPYPQQQPQQYPPPQQQYYQQPPQHYPPPQDPYQQQYQQYPPPQQHHPQQQYPPQQDYYQQQPQQYGQQQPPQGGYYQYRR